MVTNEEMSTEIRRHFTTPKDANLVLKDIVRFYKDEQKTIGNFIHNYTGKLRIYVTVYDNKASRISKSIDQLLNNENGILDDFVRVYNEKNSHMTLNDYVRINLCTSLTFWDKEHKNEYQVKIPGYYNTDTVCQFLEKYTIKGENYFDGSCGWGNRLLASMKKDVNYFGTDPNPTLNVELKKMYERFKYITHTPATADIRCVGSEIYIPEYKDKMDVAFTCPPYFFLEDYGYEGQCCNPNTNYQDWLNNFMFKTIENTIDYLKDGGIYAITVKNFRDYKIYDDVKNYLDNNPRMEFVELMEERLPTVFNAANVNIEYIQIYRKKTDKPLETFRRTQTALDDFLC